MGAGVVRQRVDRSVTFSGEAIRPLILIAAQQRSLRYARVPPVDYLDKPRSNHRGSRFNRRYSGKWVKIQPALTSQ